MLGYETIYFDDTGKVMDFETGLSYRLTEQCSENALTAMEREWWKKNTNK